MAEQKPKRIWDNNVTIGEVMVSEKTKLVVSSSIRDGIKYVNIRQWYQRRDGVWMPSLDGTCIATNPYTKDGSVLPDPTGPFMDLIEAARARFETLPLYDEANVVYAKPKEKK